MPTARPAASANTIVTVLLIAVPPQRDHFWFVEQAVQEPARGDERSRQFRNQTYHKFCNPISAFAIVWRARSTNQKCSRIGSE
jgi:hypothetical protein